MMRRSGESDSFLSCKSVSLKSDCSLEQVGNPLAPPVDVDYPLSTLTFVYLGDVITKKRNRLNETSTKAIL
jgi:hypothetical protein